MRRGRRTRSGGPVSLLAFQDVLTTVIGIILMLVMILVLELGMVRRVLERGVPPLDQVASLHEVQDRLESEWGEMSDELEAIREQIARQSNRSSISLESRIAEVRSESERVRRDRQAVEQEIDALWSKVGGRSGSELAAGVEARSALRIEAGRLKEAVDELTRSNRLTYRIGGDGRDRNKRPIVVEAGADRYRVGGIGERERVREYAAVTPSDRLALLRQQLDLFSRSERYVLLVAKPSLAEDDLHRLGELFESLGFETGFDIIPERWTVLARAPGASP